MENNSNKKIRINILTGFFGSGKTTLISNFIKADHLKNKIAIIQNEFSEEMGIEKEILTDSQGNDLGNLFELPNGCMCCQVKDNIILFLENLIQKKNEIEIIIIEAHGISDMSLFWLDQELESPLFLNSIICLIDCLNFETNKSNMYDIFTNQILSSDKILLNKVDLINEDQDKIHKIKDFLTLINPLCKITETTYSNISTEYFLEDSALNINNVINFNEISDKLEHTHEHYHEKEKIENIVIHTSIKSKEELDKVVGNILWNLSEQFNFTLIRFKGIFYSQNGQKFSIQGLYDLYEINEITSNKISDSENSKLLFIGKNLKANKNVLQQILNP